MKASNMLKTFRITHFCSLQESTQKKYGDKLQKITALAEDRTIRPTIQLANTTAAHEALLSRWVIGPSHQD